MRVNTLPHDCPRCSARPGAHHATDCALVRNLNASLAASERKSVLEEGVELTRAYQREAITIRLTRPAIARLRKLASSEGTTINALVAAILDSHLNRE